MIRRPTIAVSLCILALATQGRASSEPEPGTYGENAVAFAPDGKWLVTGGSDGRLRIRDGTTGAITATRTTPDAGADIGVVAVSPDGRTIASASNDRAIRLWDVGGRAERLVLRAPTIPIARDLQATPFPSANRASDVLTHAPDAPRRSYHHRVLALAFAPDGRTVVAGDEGGFLWSWDVATGALEDSWVGDSKRVDQVCFSPDGSTIATAGDGPGVVLWDARSHAHRRSLLQSGRLGFHLAYAPDGATLAVARDFEIMLWDPATGRRQDCLQAGFEVAPRIAFTPDGSSLVAAGDAMSYLIAIRPLGVGEGDDRCAELARAPSMTGRIALAVAPDGRRVALCFAKSGPHAPGSSFRLVGIR